MNVIIKIIYQISKVVFLLLKPMTIGVRLLLVKDHQVLLVRHVYDTKWFLPGGLVERGETLDQAVRREALEEVGATLFDMRLFGAYTNFKDGRNDHVIVFLAQDFNLNGNADHEIEQFAYFRFDQLPEKISPGSKSRIMDYLADQNERFGNW